MPASEGLDILNAVREILLKNESLKSANEKLVARNADLSSTIAELNTRLAILQATPGTQVNRSPVCRVCGLWLIYYSKEHLKPVVDAPSSTSHSETTNTVTASGETADTSSDYVPFLLGPNKRPTALINMARLARTPPQRKKSVFMIVPGGGFTWTIPFDKGSWFKPTQVYIKGGRISTISNQNFRKTIELLAHIDGRWCYVGSFKATTWTTLSPDEFLALSTISQTTIILETAIGKAVQQLHDYRSMYASGELAVVQIDIQRVGFNESVCRCLLDAAEALDASGQLPGTTRQDDPKESQDGD